MSNTYLLFFSIRFIYGSFVFQEFIDFAERSSQSGREELFGKIRCFHYGAGRSALRF